VGGISGAGEGTGAAEGNFGGLAADSLDAATAEMARAAKTQITRVVEASAIIAVRFQA
jgi:hypothetical protein